MHHFINIGGKIPAEPLDEICRRTLACAEVNIKTFDRERNNYEAQANRTKSSSQVSTDIVGANDTSETRGVAYFKATKEENK